MSSFHSQRQGWGRMKRNSTIVLGAVAACAVGLFVFAKYLERDPVDAKKDFLQALEHARQTSLEERGLPTFVPETKSDWLNYCRGWPAH